MTSNENTLNWFEISVADMDRAKKFYETIFDIKMPIQDIMGMRMAYFPAQPGNGKLSGALVKGNMHKPSMDGVKVYFNGNPDLNIALARIKAAGGKVVMPKTKIGDDIGHMAFFIDSEGNNVALHSNK